MNWKKIVCIGLFLIIVVSVAVNIIMQIELPWNIVYDGDWLGFFGAFFGAVFTVIGAIYVVYLNTVKENKRNYLIELLEFQEIFNNYMNNISFISFNYKSLLNNPTSKTDLWNFLKDEKGKIDKLHNRIIRLNVYNSKWEDISFKLKNYYDKLSDVINRITVFHLPMQPSPNMKSNTEYYITNHTDDFDKILNEAEIEPFPYKNKSLETFKTSCRNLLDSEIDRVRKYFSTE
jgi:hypothetical protein